MLQLLIDPRLWFGFGVLFFGGIVAAGEITQRREQKRVRREKDDQNRDDAT